ncbi:hypothetical protein P154DRAFT_96154 [Amniculicola lignicola CBS 123094]|uniref:Telomerase reverse transcriptase n=1 Tax=Amniculicola lignicola CBS 123094 TaxID=1392246 RepID=A0A6A5WWV5_9PLEO|nr:hypothetical protein P154DRAFT_96154 [Amniculicola lignicola CBS 123094]
MKRKRAAHVAGQPPKKPKTSSDQSAIATSSGIEHPVLRRLYPQVLSLRHYLLSRLPGSSKNRRRKILQLGTTAGHDSPASPAVDFELGQLLDATVVGVPATTVAAYADEAVKAREADFEHFSQQLPEGSGSTFKPGYFLQREIVDFVIWLLFRKAHRPSHLLCHGFHRGTARAQHADLRAALFIPGIACHNHNPNVEALKGPLWCRLHSILGQGGDRIMIDLIVDCGIFSSINGHPSNYYQISGLPLMDIKSEATTIAPMTTDNKAIPALTTGTRKLSAITFVRSRIFYARPALNAKGGIRFGMRHIHVLNRFSAQDNDKHTAHIMKYLFPRQFGLHNVFTSKNDSRESAMLFKDYTLREKEISHAMYRETSKGGSTTEQIAKWKGRVPTRLRGEPTILVNKMRKLNSKCSYVELLRHYCPVEVGSTLSIMNIADGIGLAVVTQTGLEELPSLA